MKPGLIREKMRAKMNDPLVRGAVRVVSKEESFSDWSSWRWSSHGDQSHQVKQIKVSRRTREWVIDPELKLVTKLRSWWWTRTLELDELARKKIAAKMGKGDPDGIRSQADKKANTPEEKRW